MYTLQTSRCMLIISSYKPFLDFSPYLFLMNQLANPLHDHWSTKVPVTVKVHEVCPYMYIELISCVVVLAHLIFVGESSE